MNKTTGYPYLEREVRDIAQIPRWAIIRTYRQQSVAEHSYFVSLYTDWLGTLAGLDLDEHRYAVREALWHDIGERFSGDIPTPFKKSARVDESVIDEAMGREHPWYRLQHQKTDLGAHGQMRALCIVKIADLLEAVTFLSELKYNGVQEVRFVLDSLRAHMQPRLDRVRALFSDEVYSVVASAVWHHVDDVDRPSRLTDPTLGSIAMEREGSVKDLT